ncbi:MAG TPA: magnesium transporter CorA family protein [Azospirillaceae bacterium]|nr:magnesium transporter CorA family protein [Azospirillaceae bacterium]
MITVYCRIENRIVSLVVPPEGVLPEGTVWVDLLRPRPEELEFVQTAFGIALPSREEMREIEISSRLYVEDGAVFMTTQVMYHSESDAPDQSELTCVITPAALITLRYEEPRSVATFAARVMKQPELLASPEDGLLALLDAVLDRIADVLEVVGSRIDSLSRAVFTARLKDRPRNKRSRNWLGHRFGGPHPDEAEDTEDLQEVLRGIGRAGDISHKIRDTLAGMERLTAYYASVSTNRLNKEQRTALKTVQRDIRSLVEHVGFLSHESAFLLEATLGLVNLEQNRIIKIFSIASVVFLPPTLVGTVYGMNFQHMPELAWGFGYPMALIIMLLSAILPLLYFRFRGWL